jgi:preprotein translocase subunit YajC
MKRQKGFVSILVLLLILLVIAGSFYFYPQTSKDESSDANIFDAVEKAKEVVDQTNTRFVDSIQNSDDEQGVRVKTSGINIVVPDGVAADDVNVGGYTEIRFTLGQNYWKYLGNDGIVTTGLVVSAGLESKNDSSGYLCSIKSFSNRDESDSQITAMIDGQNFIKSTGSNYGMNQFQNSERYVQMLNENQCRVVTLSINGTNLGVYNYSEKEKEEIKKNNEVFTKFLETEKAKIFNSIKIGKPLTR